jgi:tRNA(Ile)-lysidine synthase
MLQKFKENLFDNLLIRPSGKLLVAVSGGIDSMVLLHLFQCLKMDMAVAHCNFNLRGSESKTDEDFVRLQAKKNGILFFSKSFNTMLISRQSGVSVQEAARDLRYKWFDQLLSDYQFDYYATGHNFDDRLETFFINAVRGSGVYG